MARAALAAVTAALALATACESGKPRGATTATAKVASSPSAVPGPAAETSAAAPSLPAPPSRNDADAPKQSCNVALIGDSLTDYAVHGGGYARYLRRDFGSASLISPMIDVLTGETKGYPPSYYDLLRASR